MIQCLNLYSLFLTLCPYLITHNIYTTEEWSSVRDTVSRAEHTVMGDIDDSLFHQKLRVGQALSHLAEGRYLESAKIFTSIDTQLTNQFNSVISAEDLAVYGSILGLATMNRDMLHGSVIDGAFKARLEVSIDWCGDSFTFSSLLNIADYFSLLLISNISSYLPCVRFSDTTRRRSMVNALHYFRVPFNETFSLIFIFMHMFPSFLI